MMGGEDFSRYGKAGVPICLFWLGTIDAGARGGVARRTAKTAAVAALGSFRPVPEPTIKTGVLTMSMAVLNLMQKP